jgi:hypothetical protein
MLRPINFYDQLYLRGIEVNYIVSDWLLPIELYSLKLLRPQPRP